MNASEGQGRNVADPVSIRAFLVMAIIPSAEFLKRRSTTPSIRNFGESGERWMVGTTGGGVQLRSQLLSSDKRFEDALNIDAKHVVPGESGLHVSLSAMTA